MRKTLSFIVAVILISVYCGVAVAADYRSSDYEGTPRITYMSNEVTDSTQLLERARLNVDDSLLSKIDKLTGTTLQYTVGAVFIDSANRVTDLSKNVLRTTQLLEIAENDAVIVEKYAITSIVEISAVDIPGYEEHAEVSGSTYLYTTAYITKRFNELGVSTHVRFDYSTGRYSSPFAGDALVLENLITEDPYQYPVYTNSTSIQYPANNTQYRLNSPYTVMFAPGFVSMLQTQSQLFYNSGANLYSWLNVGLR